MIFRRRLWKRPRASHRTHTTDAEETQKESTPGKARLTRVRKEYSNGRKVRENSDKRLQENGRCQRCRHKVENIQRGTKQDNMSKNAKSRQESQSGSSKIY